MWAGPWTTTSRSARSYSSPTRGEFKYLEYFYFHNFIYESVWKDNRRRYVERIPTIDILRTYPHDHKLILVGDASMSPYEIVYPGGSIEHWNEEPGSVWLQRLLQAFPHAIWLNPEPVLRWDYTQSIKLIRDLMSERMYPLTFGGLGSRHARATIQAMRLLTGKSLPPTQLSKGIRSDHS